MPPALGVATVALVGLAPLGITCAVVTMLVLWACGSYRPRIYYSLGNQLP